MSQSDAIIRSRFIEKDTELIKWMNKSYQLHQAISDHQPLSQITSLYESLSKEFLTYEWSLSRLDLVQHCSTIDMNQSIAQFTTLQSQFLDTITQISELRKQIQEAGVVLKQQEESDKIKRIVVMDPSRSETENVIANLKAEIEKLEKEHEDLDEEWSETQKEFALLAAVTNRLEKQGRRRKSVGVSSTGSNSSNSMDER